MASSSEREEQENVLDPSEQTMRPLDVALHQQRIQAWHPILDPVWVIVALFYLGVILVPTGFKLEDMQSQLVERKVTYDDYNAVEKHNCSIGDNFNANQTCFINVTIPKDLTPPILIYYELSNFHQNHRNYYVSRDEMQLKGKVDGQNSVYRQRCDPLNTLGNITLNPCGLIANTMFNDVITLVAGRDAYTQQLEMIETGIAWQSDIEYMFGQPEGFTYEQCTSCGNCSCEGEEWSCKKPYQDKYGDCYRYYYPNDNETQYLYETYPDVVSPLEGVTNEHFVVWMRVATQPTFRKLYGWIDQPIRAGETLTFRIQANFVVNRFRGSKSLIIANNNIFGGKNQYMGPLFYGVGFFCLGMGLFFALKHAFRPRKLADPRYLHYKEE